MLQLYDTLVGYTPHSDVDTTHVAVLEVVFVHEIQVDVGENNPGRTIPVSFCR